MRVKSILNQVDKYKDFVYPQFAGKGRGLAGKAVSEALNVLAEAELENPAGFCRE